MSLLLVNQQVRSVRLVDDEGFVRKETFYKYLMVWFNMDFMGYTMSQVCEIKLYCVPQANRHLMSHDQLFFCAEKCEIIPKENYTYHIA